MRPCNEDAFSETKSASFPQSTYEFLKHALVERTLRFAACVILLRSIVGQIGLPRREGNKYTPGYSAPDNPNALQTVPSSCHASC